MKVTFTRGSKICMMLAFAGGSGRGNNGKNPMKDGRSYDGGLRRGIQEVIIVAFDCSMVGGMMLAFAGYIGRGYNRSDPMKEGRSYDGGLRCGYGGCYNSVKRVGEGIWCDAGIIHGCWKGQSINETDAPENHTQSNK